MQTSQKSPKLSLVFLSFIAFALSCGSGHQFHGPVVPGEAPPLQAEGDEAVVDKPSTSVTNGSDSIITTPNATPPVVADPIPEACSTLYGIPGIANPYLAGMPVGTEIAYPASVDRMPINAPIQVQPDNPKCLEPGGNLYFRVEGKIAHGTMADQESNADGIPIYIGTHTLGSLNNLSNIKAPINSLLGIFLDDRTPEQRQMAPEMLNFGEAPQRDFKSLAPKLGQIFFIGDGKDSTGKLQAFKVPAGTTRLYLAIMDAYEWNNNLGKLSGGIMWIKQ